MIHWKVRVSNDAGPTCQHWCKGNFTNLKTSTSVVHFHGPFFYRDALMWRIPLDPSIFKSTQHVLHFSKSYLKVSINVLLLQKSNYFLVVIFYIQIHIFSLSSKRLRCDRARKGDQKVQILPGVTYSCLDDNIFV